MDARVTALETDMKDVKATLGRIDLSLARIDGKLEHLATKADLATAAGAITALGEKVLAQDKRLGAVETAINDTIKSAVGKAIGPWQLPGVLRASGVVVLALMGALNWMAHQSWFTH